MAKETRKDLGLELLLFIKNGATVDEIQRRIGELEDTMSALDEQIEATSDVDTVDVLAKARNDLNLVRIDLSLKANSLERRMLEFEKARALAE